MTIFINNLVCHVIIGILPHERIAKQTIQCSIEIDYEGDHFIDYALVKEYIQSTLHTEEFGLIEEALHHIAHGLQQQFRSIKRTFLRIEKMDIFDNCTVGVSETFTY
jgi:dihydroneopterin aldolase